MAWGIRLLVGLAVVILQAATAQAYECAGTSCPVEGGVGVEIGVGDTLLTVSGQTSPNAFVTVRRGTDIIGTFAANPSGAFSQTFTAQPPGIHTVSVYSIDAAGAISDTVSQSLNITKHFETTFNTFLPPTYTISSLFTRQGEPLRLFGQTVPGASVRLVGDYRTIGIVTADSKGEWYFNADSRSFSLGYHRIYVVALSGSGLQSLPTRWKVFRILAGSAPTPGVGGGKLALDVPSSFPPPGTFAPGSGEKINVSLDQNRFGLLASGTIKPRLRFLSGDLPFWVEVDWGDKIVQNFAFDQHDASLEHKYDRPGLYQVRIIVMDAAGRTGSVTAEIKVYSVAEASGRALSLLILLLIMYVAAKFAWKWFMAQPRGKKVMLQLRYAKKRRHLSRRRAKNRR